MSTAPVSAGILQPTNMTLANSCLEYTKTSTPQNHRRCAFQAGLSIVGGYAAAAFGRGAPLPAPC